MRRPYISQIDFLENAGNFFVGGRLHTLIKDAEVFQKPFEPEGPFVKKFGELCKKEALAAVVAVSDRFSLDRGLEESDDGVRAVPVVIEPAEEFEAVHVPGRDRARAVCEALNRFPDSGKIGFARVDQDVVDIEEDNVETQAVTAPFEAEEKSFAYLAKIPFV